jgi:hypothetical protein
MPKSRRRYGSRNNNVVEAEAVAWAEGNMGGAAIARRIAPPDDWQRHSHCARLRSLRLPASLGLLRRMQCPSRGNFSCGSWARIL